MLFRILGPVEVHTTTPGRLPAGKPAAVLASLLLRPNTWVGVDRLIETVWPGRTAPPSAEANLKTYVWQLRRLLPEHDGGSRIERTVDAYRIRVAPGELDANRAADLAAAARAADSADAAVTLLQEALRLWRGQPLEGVEVADPALNGLGDLHLDLREQLGEAQLTLGRGADATRTLRSLTTDAPLRENAWTLLVRALHATGLHAEAMIAYRQAVDVLAGELGVEPGPALIEAHRTSLGGARRELPRDIRLTGRTDELAALCGTAPVVLVEGMPGVGKTALVVHAAHRLAPHFPDGQIFVTLDGGVPPAARLLRTVGITNPPADPDEQAALWRSEVARRRMLIVLDGAVDATQVQPLLPAAPGSRTFVTTARRGWHLDGAARLPLHPLNPADAAALLDAAALPHAAALTGTALPGTALPGTALPGAVPRGAVLLSGAAGGRLGADPGAKRAILASCGGLPAALLDAAARLQTRPHWTLRRLADELRADPCRVFSGAVRRSLGAACRGLDLSAQAAWRALAGQPAEFTAPATAWAAHESLVDHGLLESVGPDRYRSHVVIRHLAGCRGLRAGRRAA